MAKSSKLRVMISSRCDDLFPASGGRALSEIRKDLKQEIEALEAFGRKIFGVMSITTPQRSSVRPTSKTMSRRA